MRWNGAILLLIGGVVGGAAGGACATWLLAAPLRPAATVAVPPPDRLEQLVWRVAELEREADLAVAAVASAPAAQRTELDPAPRLPVIEGASRGGEGDPAALDPRRLLAEYVASFEGGGDGSDFFRMAVAAYAWTLRRDLHAIVLDRAAPDALRLQVLAMLDGGSFRGDAETIDALLELLRAGGFEAAELQALALLGRIGDRRTAELIEALTPALTPLRVRAAAWDALVALCDRGAEAVLLRLLEREGDAEAQEQLLRRFHGVDAQATLRALELASRFADRSPRLRGATLIGTQRDAAFVALAHEWHGREPDDEVRARLAAALDEQKSLPGWHELQACGEPNAPIGSDDQRAWAPATADGGREWIELDYAAAQEADRVTIHQTCTAGALIEVAVAGRDGNFRSVWSGRDQTATVGPFTVRFDAQSDVARVRVVLDTALTSGWNEIDAVQLAGPDGAAWASGARASSRYGQGGGASASARELDFASFFGRGGK